MHDARNQNDNCTTCVFAQYPVSSALTRDEIRALDPSCLYSRSSKIANSEAQARSRLWRTTHPSSKRRLKSRGISRDCGHIQPLPALATAHWHIPRVAFVHGHFHHHACGCSAAECARKFNLVRDLVPCSCPSSGATSPCGRSTNSVQLEGTIYRVARAECRRGAASGGAGLR